MKELQKIADEIAKHLFEELTLSFVRENTEEKEWARLITPAKYRKGIGMRVEQHRIRIFSLVPMRGVTHAITTRAFPTIWVKADREPASIARDILRRFWDDYVIVWNEAVEYLDCRIEAENKLKANVEKVKALFETTNTGYDDLVYARIKTKTAELNPIIRCSNSDSYKLEIDNLTLDQLEKIKTLLSL